MTATTRQPSTTRAARPRGWLVTGLAMLIFAAAMTGGMLADPADPFTQPLDDASHDTLAAGSNDTATAIARAFMVLGNAPWTYLTVAVAAVVVVVRRSWPAAPYLAGVIIVTSIIVIPWLKEQVGRQRPPDQMAEVSSQAFPSGHSGYAAAIAVALVLVLFSQRTHWWWLAAAFTLGMMWSRLYLSVHWLTDTVAGSLVGGSVAFTLYWAVYPWIYAGE